LAKQWGARGRRPPPPTGEKFFFQPRNLWDVAKMEFAVIMVRVKFLEGGAFVKK
jgi:hypothetical protein